MLVSPVAGIIHQHLEASFGEKPADDDSDNFLSSLEPLPGIVAPVARSDLLEYEEDYEEEPQGPSYAYTVRTAFCFGFQSNLITFLHQLIYKSSPVKMTFLNFSLCYQVILHILNKWY